MNNNEISNSVKPSGLLAHIVALMVVMIWGGTFVNTRVLIDRGLLPEEIYVLRTLLGYICIWFISPKKLFCDTLKDELVVLLLGIFGSSLYFLTENYALKLTVANDVSFIVCTTPLVTVILALLFLKSVKASLPLAIGSVLALLGVALGCSYELGNLFVGNEELCIALFPLLYHA